MACLIKLLLCADCLLAACLVGGLFELLFVGGLVDVGVGLCSGGCWAFVAWFV